MLKGYLCLPLIFCIIYCYNQEVNSYLFPTQEYAYYSKDYKRVARHVEPNTGNVLFHIIKQLKHNYPKSKYLNSRQSMPKVIALLKKKLKNHYNEKRKVTKI